MHLGSDIGDYFISRFKIADRRSHAHFANRRERARDSSGQKVHSISNECNAHIDTPRPCMTFVDTTTPNLHRMESTS
ncbi:hypothetical protein [Dyella sp. 333MFSha]|uniref:hypothetical protein n=1 Tax=Dyella sp. 333MFSha TaxID=1798240 RepID=UPI000B81856D|nr:hypothetical protein [Dyella sp. 333MFSha]